MQNVGESIKDTIDRPFGPSLEYAVILVSHCPWHFPLPSICCRYYLITTFLSALLDEGSSGGRRHPARGSERPWPGFAPAVGDITSLCSLGGKGVAGGGWQRLLWLRTPAALTSAACSAS